MVDFCYDSSLINAFVLLAYVFSGMYMLWLNWFKKAGDNIIKTVYCQNKLRPIPLWTQSLEHVSTS